MKAAVWTAPLLLILSYNTINSQFQDDYNQYSFYQRRPLSPRPLDAMADLTNDLGVCVLRVIASGGTIGNIAFSPFGLMAVSVLLYEGSSGYTALQIKQSLNLPWEILAVRIGVRDLNRYLKTYFKSDGFLNGLTMSREEVCLRPQFKQVLRLYGFDDPNSFLVDSCPESVMTTMKPVQPMSVTTQGTVVTEMTPISQIIQVSTNFTNTSASETVSTVSTERPALVTHMSDAGFTITNINTNTNPSMNSQTNTMMIDIETQPNIRPIESSTSQVETTVLIKEQEPKSSNEVGVTNKKPSMSIPVTMNITEANSIPVTSDDPMIAVATMPQMSMDNSSVTTNLQIEKLIDTSNTAESYGNTYPMEMSTNRLYESTTIENTPQTLSVIDIMDVNRGTSLPSDFNVASTEYKPQVTDMFTESIQDTTVNSQLDSLIDIRINKTDITNNTKYVLAGNTTDATTFMVSNDETTYNDETTIVKNDSIASTTETIPSTKSIINESDNATTVFETANTIPAKVTDQTTFVTISELENNDDTMIMASENDVMSTTEFGSTEVSPSNATENEIIKEAESNHNYQFMSLENKNARSFSDSLPTFNVEFVVRKEDLQNDCNHTKKRTMIKPDRILTEYPKHSGVSIMLRESKKRKRRHLEQYQGYNTNHNQWLNGHKNYRPASGWVDRSSNSFESEALFNAGYRRIPFFTYTAVLPFGYIFELKSQAIEIPLDDPKYTLMILMPNHPDGLSELLLQLPTMSVRNIHNSLKPTAVHATIPMFKYTAKVDLTSALQQVGVRDVFYRYRADLSFMSPDARLFVSSVQQVVSVTVKKYNTPPVYEIQRKYVERDVVISRPFVYFVIDIHTKVSLIAGVITDPLASPIWL